MSFNREQNSNGNLPVQNTKSIKSIGKSSLPDWAGKLVIPGTLRIAVPAPDDAGISHLSWPKAVIAKNGTIILAYCAGVGHNRGGSGPAISISEDNGATFSNPKLLSYYPDDDDRYVDCGNLAIGTAEDGTVIILAMAFNGDKANNIFGWRSKDNGRTWKSVDTSELGPNKTGSVCGTIVQLPEGKLMVMGHYRLPERKNFGIWQSVSHDNGQTWGTPKMVTNIKGVEPVLVRSGNRLIVFIRGQHPSQTSQFLAVSDDFGETWYTGLSNISAQSGHTNTIAHPFAMVNPKNSSELLAITAERPLPGNFWLWRGNSNDLKFEIDKCLIKIPKIEGNPNTDYGYTWMINTGGNRYLLFYYHGKGFGANSIWVAEFKL